MVSGMWSTAPRAATGGDVGELYDLTIRLFESGTGHQAVAKAFRRCSEFFAERGDFRQAIAAAKYEVAVWEGMDDLGGCADALRSLARLYRSEAPLCGLGRLGMVIDCAEGLLEIYQIHGDVGGAARMRREVGVLHLELDRTADAVWYCRQALATFDKTSGNTGFSGEHRADYLVPLGRALWADGHPTAARKRFREALDGLPRWAAEKRAELAALLAVPLGTAELPAASAIPMGEFCRPVWPERQDCVRVPVAGPG